MVAISANYAAASAPAKVILLGEHAVNRGQPGLVTAVDRRVRCTARPSDDDRFHLWAEGREAAMTSAEMETFRLRVEELVATGERACLRALVAEDFFAPVRFALTSWLVGQDGPALTLTWEGTIPIASGLGSGAAAAASGLQAAAALRCGGLARKELHRLARLGDVVAHGGLASGLDTAGAIYGGVVGYTVDQGAHPLAIGQPPTLVVADTGVRASTAVVNGRLQARLEREPRLPERFSQIGALVARAERLLSAADWPTIGQLMNENQAILAELGVSSPEIERLVVAAKDAGALGAKLSGSGGGGIVVALVDPDTAEAVVAACRAAGAADAFAVVAGAEGTRIEEVVEA